MIIYQKMYTKCRMMPSFVEEELKMRQIVLTMETGFLSSRFNTSTKFCHF